MILLLLGLVVFFFVALTAVIVTVGLTLGALVTLVTAPRQLVDLFRDRAVRRNHALEHATINVVEERYGPTQLSGLARADGFIIQGGAGPELVASAAEEALTRLQAGERTLAIHPRCGTTLVATQLVLAIAFIIALIVIKELTLWPFLIGLAAAALIGPRLSPLLQRWVTTDAHIDALAISGIAIEAPRSARGLVSLVTLAPVLVRTSQDGMLPFSDGDPLSTSRNDEIPVGDFRVR